MTGIDPVPLELPVCSNGPHTPTPATTWQDRIWHRLPDGRWICHGCWTVGGITDDDEPEPC